jgi:hypothetical protein
MVESLKKCTKGHLGITKLTITLSVPFVTLISNTASRADYGLLTNTFRHQEPNGSGTAGST